MKIQLVLMASGFGRRFGSHKLEVFVHGRPLYTYGMKSLCQAAQAFLPSSGIDCQVTVVTAHDAIASACQAQGIDVLHDPSHGRQAGQAVYITAVGRDDRFMGAHDLQGQAP